MKDVEVIKARNVLSTRARTNLTKRLRVAAYCRVSTDSEDQLNSYKSQVKYYTDLIKSKPEWDLAGIYADEAITGTQVTKREDFQRLINDCMNGDIDMIVTKSISRFARNTLDTLKYVRMLKEKGIAVFFEEENINTLTMDGELLLVILSSVAQQEVENISANVKKGLKMKMQRGELVGFQGCLGYDYHPEDKTITVNEEEAEIVRYIFRRYTEGAGGSVIAHELENLGYKTKRGSTRWAETTVIGIIKNEKYKGDILMGKTFTLDPISKRRLDNFGEEDQFYIRDHHEPIISEEMFDKAQEILKRRAKPRRLGTDGKREKFSRKYAFSCMLECGFCGGTLTRRSWHSGSQYNKVIWQCVTATKKGKKFCPDSKGIAEETIEQAFIESYRLLCQNNKDVLDEFIARTEETLSGNNASKQLSKIEKDIAALEHKRAKLVDMRLEEIIDKETYEQKYFDLSSQIDQLQKQREDLQQSAETESTMKRRISEFRKTLEQNEVLDTFDRYVFESIVEKVIVGGYDEDGNKDPSMLTFIYKTGFKNSVDGSNFKPPRKNSKAAKQRAGLCSHTTDEAKETYSYHSDDTCGMYRSLTKRATMTRKQSGGGHCLRRQTRPFLSRCTPEAPHGYDRFPRLRGIPAQRCSGLCSQMLRFPAGSALANAPALRRPAAPGQPKVVCAGDGRAQGQAADTGSGLCGCPERQVRPDSGRLPPPGARYPARLPYEQGQLAHLAAGRDGAARNRVRPAGRQLPADRAACRGYGPRARQTGLDLSRQSSPLRPGRGIRPRPGDPVAPAQPHRGGRHRLSLPDGPHRFHPVPLRGAGSGSSLPLGGPARP